MEPMKPPRPSDEDVEKALAIARERGLLTDEGWVWETDDEAEATS